MDIETGELICPKCKNKKMDKATNIFICNGFFIIHISVKNMNAYPYLINVLNLKN